MVTFAPHEDLPAAIGPDDASRPLLKREQRDAMVLASIAMAGMEPFVTDLNAQREIF